jgi:hypothetical protein
VSLNSHIRIIIHEDEKVGIGANTTRRPETVNRKMSDEIGADTEFYGKRITTEKNETNENVSTFFLLQTLY